MKSQEILKRILSGNPESAQTKQTIKIEYARVGCTLFWNLTPCMGKKIPNFLNGLQQNRGSYTIYYVVPVQLFRVYKFIIYFQFVARVCRPTI